MVVYPMIYRISYMSGGDRPQPSTETRETKPTGLETPTRLCSVQQATGCALVKEKSTNQGHKTHECLVFFFWDFWMPFFFDRFSEISHGFLPFYHSFLFSFVPFFVSYFWAFCCFHFHVEIIATAYFLLAFLDFNRFQLRTLLFQRHSVFFPFQFHPQTSLPNRWRKPSF